ncbi:transcription factor TGA1-like isoform X2 [Telopea speciosissima]|uniref:transcription factor TGA1-like isoform X2 n=1 Tax=Telopea speciosissima TaxID=54955 RepID=UPI001CC6DEBE|nr:transcription factor TGA1-like isoform X2 [Telopea speciosissima]
MNSPSTQFPASRTMGLYQPAHLISMWGESLKGSSSPNTGLSTIVGVETKLDDKSEETSHGALGPSKKYNQEARKLSDKVLRRLAQNREAARKSRLRKKAYVQQLESSRLKLTQLEQELERVRQQGVYVGGAYDTNHLGLSETVNSGVATFEMEYGHWVEEQTRQTHELRTALQACVTDIELRILVDCGMNHYYDLFRMKGAAARADVFYVMSGMWKTSAERFFMWIGGFRPSELLKVLLQQLDTLTEQQLMDVYNLQQSSQQAEDALSQGMEKLQLTLAETLAADPLGAESYASQMTKAMEKLDDIVSFVNQADHIRQQTLLQMTRILTTRQAAQGLVALGDYFHCLRALSSIWAACPREPA